MNELSDIESTTSPTYPELSDQNLIIRISLDSINLRFGHIPVMKTLPNRDESYGDILRICRESHSQLIILLANDSLEQPLARWLRHHGIELVVLTIREPTALDSAINLVEEIQAIKTHATFVITGCISFLTGTIWTCASLASWIDNGQNADFQSLWKGPLLMVMGITLFWIFLKHESLPDAVTEERRN